MGKDINEQLYAASKEGDVDKVTELLDHGTHTESTNGYDSTWTPLLISARHGHDEIVALLLDRCANIEHTNAFGHTALTLSCFHGHLTTSGILIKRGANINTQCSRGLTPLLEATAKRYDNIIALLLDHGANINITDRLGITCLDFERYFWENY